MRIIRVQSFKDRQITVELENGEHVTMSFEEFVKRAKENE